MSKRLFILLLPVFLAGCAVLRPGSNRHADSSSLSMDAGNFSSIHPLENPGKLIEQLGASAPHDGKDHTYLFFINGLDPYYLANFRGQCQYMKMLGYSHAYCGQMSHVALFRQAIQEICRDDARAQIVIVGYSLGANSARTLVNQLKEDRIKIDLLVYLGGDTIVNAESSRPSNAERILNINGHGSILLGYDLFVKGADIDGASNHRLNARHFLLPTRAEATELLVRHVVEMNRNRMISAAD